VPSRLHRVLLWVHRWVGLTVGLVFTVVSVSGSLILFQPQYFQWAHGDLLPEELSGHVSSIDRWVENGRRAVPHLQGPIAIWAPHVEHNVSPAGMLVFGGQQPGGLGNMGFAGVLVAPDSGDVLGVIDIDRSPAYAPLFLHRDLWAGTTGQVVSGIVAVGTLILLVIGLYLWWPASMRLGRKLWPRDWRKTFTHARPLHDWVGVWTFGLLAVLTGTGLYLVRPAWVSPVLDVAAGPETAAIDHPDACGLPIGFDEAMTRAASLVARGEWKAVYPGDTAQRWEITFATHGRNAMHDETHVIADLQCGIVTVDATPQNRSTREAAEMWLIGVHDGSAFGPIGIAVVTLAGFLPIVLTWSGFRLWLRRRAIRPVQAEGRGRLRQRVASDPLSS